MKDEILVCPICGEPTRIYMGNARKDRLCGKHADMLKAGELILNENGKYSFKSGKEKSVAANNGNTKNGGGLTCIICGEHSDGKPQCKKCYYETKDFMGVLDKNSTIRKTRDYYYNLKERILIIKSLEETKKQCNKLIAIAMVAEQYNDDTSLMDRVYKDVEILIKGKQAPQANDRFEEERKEKDESKSRINTAEDGHNVDSEMEVKIDDILYNARIIHSYGKSIEEITEKRKKCDWFIPITANEGIYIEYWGMKTPKYLEERREKEELYKKYNIPYISIEQDDPKKDTQTFKSNLVREITMLAEKYYKFMPKWH